jgi:putative glutamine amidotransferase
MKQKIRIGITDCSKYNNYKNWLLSTEDNVELINLSYKTNNANKVEECDGIVLSGGEDLHPKFYNGHEYLSLLDQNNIDEQRDEFEWKVIENSFRLNRPVLGICRGLQAVNVFLGGTLVYDIPSVLEKNEHGKKDGIDQQHLINVEKDSLLYHLTNAETGEVNSAHHQAALATAKDLRVVATSGSVTEAMEWKQPQNNSWLLLVQWHPERMIDQKSAFASNIKTAFTKQMIDK